MAWPNHCGYNVFWDGMAGSPGNSRGVGVDHAGPEVFMNPDAWSRWLQRGGYEDWMGPWGHHGRRGSCRGQGRRHGMRGGPEGPPPEQADEEGVTAREKENSPDTMMRENTADPPEEIPDPGEHGSHRHHGRRGSCSRRGRGGPRGGHRHHGPHHCYGGPRGFHHPSPPPFVFGGLFGPPPPPPHVGPHGHPHGPPPFDLGPLLNGLANHPYAHVIRECLERAQNASRTRDVNNNNSNNNQNETSDNEDGMENVSFQPPVDVFDQAHQWVIHMALPGAKKEDVGVNWDTDRSILSISGVVYRPGDEEFLQSLFSGERAVGLFGRDVRLPLKGHEGGENGKDEVDAENIVAKMEDGVLVVTVPKIEKGWTDVKKVGVE